MKAMILAAGLGTRLRPLTDERPKALMPVANKPAILWNTEYLSGFGATRIIVNVHHHFQQILDFLEENPPPGVDIEVLIEPEILGTGGGIKNTEDFWEDEPFIVVNSDVLTNIPLSSVYAYHIASGALATMVLHDRPPYNKIRLDPHGYITEIPHVYGSDGLAFTGIHIIRPELLDHIPKRGFSDIIDCYRELIQRGKPIYAYVAQDHYWHDIGDLANYFKANRELAGQAVTIGPETVMDSTAEIGEWAVIGKGCKIEAGVLIRGSILWDHVRVRRGTRVINQVRTILQSVSL